MIGSIGKQLSVALLLLIGAVSSRAAVILQYHHIGDEFPVSTSVSLERFERHLKSIEDHGFTVVALPDLVARLRDGQLREATDKQVAITFDDAYISVLTRAYPLLKARGWPFTVFVNTASVDSGTGGVLSWSQLKSMTGVSIANHTRTHAHLIRRLSGETDALWEVRIRQEIEQAESRIEQQTGQSHRLLAYPYGEYDWALLELVGAMGYAAVGQQSGAVGQLSDLRALPRFPFAGHYGAPDDFADKLNSLPLPVRGVWLEDSSRQRAPLVLPAEGGTPRLVLQLPFELAQKLSCFASGQGAIPVAASAERAIVSLRKDLPPGRSRVNCTAPADDGRFYWYSHPFIRPLANGSWYQE